MAKIRHIAIKVEDQEKAATFYKETFGMTEAWRGPVRMMASGRSILPTATSIWRCCRRAAGARGSITLASSRRHESTLNSPSRRLPGAQGDAAKKPSRRPFR